MIANGIFPNVFIQKLDNAGNFVWAGSMGGGLNDYGSCITIDPTGNVYITGRFEDTADFDPTTGTLNLTSNGASDVFIQKLNTAGNLIWARSIGGTSSDYGNSITTDASGNVYVTGYYQGTVDFDPGSGTVNLTSNGSNDVFIQKLDANGILIWANSIGGISD
ncbi:MAG: SBBP repeat-containing protein, partial [Bacteroidetes bacterium]|nr:SBBP repeat-containing protein [Bacteroidota bacterium]